MLNIARIELEEQLKDMQVQLVKAQQERREVLFKLLEAKDKYEHYWRRQELWSSSLFVTRLKVEIVDLEAYLDKIPDNLLITTGVTYG